VDVAFHELVVVSVVDNSWDDGDLLIGIDWRGRPSCGKNTEGDGSDPLCLVETDHRIDNREASHDGASRYVCSQWWRAIDVERGKCVAYKIRNARLFRNKMTNRAMNSRMGLEQETIEQRVEDRVEKVEKVLRRLARNLKKGWWPM
jgi:hypothetical protein